MKIPAMKALAAAGLIALASLAPAAAGTNMRAAAKLTEAECSACHMAFPAPFLPARSWKTIMNTLDNHFGEDASLDEASRAQIEAYLTANAADTGGNRQWMLRGVGENEYILRITEMPWWVREHSHEVSQRAWARAGSKSNCLACHRSAGRGGYDDD